MEIPPQIPRWGNLFTSWIGKSVLHLSGWRLDVKLPNRPKMVLIYAPHTSNWDFVFGLAAILALQVRVHWFGKHTIFRPPFRNLLIKLGGIPIDRSAAVGVVQQTTQQFAEKEQLLIGLAPEGTRSLAPKWKSGFYQIAHAAGVPIQISYLDYKKKIVSLGPLIETSGDYAADLEKIQSFYRGINPCIPEKFAAQG
ncbi:MAG: lysophospholipid acyltransferase family protein [Pseudomonadota bacterium]